MIEKSNPCLNNFLMIILNLCVGHSRTNFMQWPPPLQSGTFGRYLLNVYIVDWIWFIFWRGIMWCRVSRYNMEQYIKPNLEPSLTTVWLERNTDQRYFKFLLLLVSRRTIYIFDLKLYLSTLLIFQLCWPLNSVDLSTLLTFFIC